MSLLITLGFRVSYVVFLPFEKVFDICLLLEQYFRGIRCFLPKKINSCPLPLFTADYKFLTTIYRYPCCIIGLFSPHFWERWSSY